MKIKENDWVVHSQHGVGRVVGFETREFEEGDGQLYFRIAIEMGTLWVPVAASSSELRRLTPKRDLAQFRALLKSRPQPLAADHRQRRTELLEKLKDSSFQARCEVVRDLTALGWGKSLNESCAAILRVVRQDLCSEWATSDGQSFAAASHEVEGLLLEGRKAFEG
jgi:RNA polymerase-interacting CarD/CdnL/TRCF family regulator